jgi:hypothetical protein
MKPAAGSSILAAALIVSLVWLSPARALADELPKDTNQIERLTPEQAKKLAAEFPGVWVVIDPSTTYMRRSLPLNGLNSLDAETATALAAYPEGPLLLDGLTTLDAATTKALAEFKGSALWLNGLTTLDAATAKALAEFKGDYLHLDGVTKLDVDIAKILAEFKGSWLGLGGLTTLDAATASTSPRRSRLSTNGMATSPPSSLSNPLIPSRSPPPSQSTKARSPSRNSRKSPPRRSRR